MPSKKPNNSVPPYISGKEFNYFLHMLNNGIPNLVDEAYLIQIGVTAGNTASLLAALRWLHLIDTWGRPYPDATLLSRLANHEPDAFKQILQQISPYKELMDRGGLNRLSIADAAKFFRNSKYKVVEGTDTKCARFFFYMAREADIKLGETIELPPDFRLVRIEQQNSQHNSTSFEDLNDIEEDLFDVAGIIDSIGTSIKNDPERLTPELLQSACALIMDESTIDEGKAAGKRLLGAVSDLLKRNPQLASNPSILKEITTLRQLLSGKVKLD